MKKIRGKVHKFGNNINTDEIIPAKFLNTSDAGELARHCMEGISLGFAKKVKKHDIIVAGENFGCGSSREHAPLSIKACGVSCVVAKSFARIFYRNAINIGLPILECKDSGKIVPGNKLEINLAKGEIKDLSTGKTYFAQSFPKFMQELINAGGLLSYIRRHYKK
ncbi:MAG: 3-isopropylmalate dehydratase small subunit [Candidatus Omnitrophica bacterium]|nr:3-isopropylmalate dehydratase small subunit [Candidatus Omnitrophota bacterium]